MAKGWSSRTSGFDQGIFGIGGEAFGPICMATSSHEEAWSLHITDNMRGAIVVGGSSFARRGPRAIEVGVAGIVAGGVDDADLKAMLGYDLGVAITGSERIGLTVVITEGFGEIAMSERTSAFCKNERAAKPVSMADQIRAGVMRPEIVIPVEANDTADDADSQWEGAIGHRSPLRVIRDPWFGRIGTVSSLPAEPAVLDSGSRTGFSVDFGNGESDRPPGERGADRGLRSQPCRAFRPACCLSPRRPRLRPRRPKHRFSTWTACPCWCGCVLCGGGGVLDSVARSGGQIKVREIAGLKAIEEAWAGRPKWAVGALCSWHPRCLGNPNHRGHHRAFQSGQNRSGVRRQGGSAGGTNFGDGDARETVQEAFLAAGDRTPTTKIIYYVTDEQFGCGVSLGHDGSKKPAACIYMGCFYAESLILAETATRSGPFRSLVRPCPPSCPSLSRRVTTP